jgi:predicted DNA-binding transcriptional regulator AlpA
MNTNTYLTQREAADILRISQRTLERHRLTGTGPKFMKAGRRVLYRPVDIEAWMAANTFRSTAEMTRGA